MKLLERKYKRDIEIVYLRDNLQWTFTKIGQKYDISKGRVRQLYTRIKNERMEANKQMKIGA